MKIFKYKTNLLLFFSVILFIITSIFHYNNIKAVKAYNWSGSAGGRIVAIFQTPPPSSCGGVPCACSATYTTTIMPSGGAGANFCFPVSNKPITGSPITASSMSTQVLGFWTASGPTAISANWGTAP